MALILASTSAIRLEMLKAAGVEVEAVAPGVDEAELKGGADPKATALLLAEAKARAVSARRPGEWAIGGDSLVSVDDRLFDKPRSRVTRRDAPVGAQVSERGDAERTGGY